MPVTLPMPVDYASSETPANYVCQCGKSGVKLWRRYNAFLEQQELYCIDCACIDQDKKRYPTEDGKSLYTDVVKHWYRREGDEPGWWRGYDPTKGVPADALEVKSENERHDQIGWLIPAVPTEEGDSFWGYTSVPQPGCEWWYRLSYRLPDQAPVATA
jgi:hypothetical protein